MKPAVVILALLAALFAFLFFKKSSALTVAEDMVATNQVACSNQVDKLQIERALANGTAANTKSNLQYTLDRRTADLLIFSNRLVQANLLIQTAQNETRAAQAEVQALAVSNAVLAVRQEDLARQLQVIPGLEARLASLGKRYDLLDSERDRLEQALQAVRLERADLARLLDDPKLLRAQVEKAEDDEALRRKAATHSINPSDRRLRVEMQPDGSVRTVVPSKPGSH